MVCLMQTVAVAKEGASKESKESWLLKVVCEITVLPGNPTKSFLEGEDWDVVSNVMGGAPGISIHLLIFLCRSKKCEMTPRVILSNTRPSHVTQKK